MPHCRNCGKLFEWGWDHESDRWVLLEPIDSDNDMFKSFIDENGIARADHRDRCSGGVTVAVTRLISKIPPEEKSHPAGPCQHCGSHDHWTGEHDALEESIGDAQDAAADEKGWFAKMRGK